MTTTRIRKATLLSLSAIALFTAAVAQAQPEPELPPLSAEPAPPQPKPLPPPPSQPEAQPQPQPAPAGQWQATPPASPPQPADKPEAAPPKPLPPPRIALSRWTLPVAGGRTEPAEPPDAPAAPVPKSFFQMQVGVRAIRVADATFGVFSDNKALGQLGAAVSYTVATAGQLSFAPGISFELGGVQSRVRGDESKLDTQRVALRLEGRYHFVPWAYGFVRAAPGGMRQAYEVNDPLAPAPMRQSHLVPAVDASGGVAFLIVPHGAPSVHHARFWLEVDGGYGWAGRKDLVLSPDVDDAGARLGTLALGSLALRGPFVRFSCSLTF
jgi:hypothetical protein